MVSRGECAAGTNWRQAGAEIVPRSTPKPTSPLQSAPSMSTKQGKKAADNPLIAENRKARHEYFIEETYEAGLSLMGWEV